MRWTIRFFLGLAIVLVIAAFFSFKRVPSETPWPTDRVFVALFSPVAKVWRSAADAILSRARLFNVLWDARQENAWLQDEVDGLKAETLALRLAAGFSEETKGVEATYQTMGKHALAARILGYSLFSQSKTAWVDCGQKEGVQVNDVVVDKDGLVGRIYQVYDDSAKVLLLIDAIFAVDAMNPISHARSLVRGLDTNHLEARRYPFLTQMEFIGSAQEMKVADHLVTSGLGAIYPYGIPIGKVLTVQSSDEKLFGKSLLLPAVDFAKLTHVYVLTGGKSIKAEDVH